MPLELLAKVPTGIEGLDQITNGGFPKGRTTLVCGGPGHGKTLIAMEFLLHGVQDHDEPGVFVSFEETPEELACNVASLGWDLSALEKEGKFFVEHIVLDWREFEEMGEYDLEGLFIRLGSAIDSIGAKRVALDTLEALFSALPNEAILRSELRRLFRWLKDKNVTTVITGERGERTLSRYGLEEYVSDCVIDLSVRVEEDIATRRLRIIKYRGSLHGVNEYPFIISEAGITVIPVTSIGLDYSSPDQRISSGVERLDTMLGGKGYFKGSSILISGASGTGKSSLAATFAQSVCARAGRCLFLSFEESPEQITRNMRSIGLDLAHWKALDLLRIHATRPTSLGLEMHLLTMFKLVEEFDPEAVVIDPLSSLSIGGNFKEVQGTLLRFVDFLKAKGITSLFTDLTPSAPDAESSQSGISSLMDTWILLRNLESAGERNRALFVIKSRGMAHSNQVREFVMSDSGITLIDVYLGPEGVLMGSARAGQEAKELALATRQNQEREAKRRALEDERTAVEAHIATLRQSLLAKEREMETLDHENEGRFETLAADRVKMATLRKADSDDE